MNKEMERHAKQALYHLYTVYGLSRGRDLITARKVAKWSLGRRDYLRHLNEWMREGEGVTTTF